jgi:hypothetical protein
MLLSGLEAARQASLSSQGPHNVTLLITEDVLDAVLKPSTGGEASPRPRVCAPA